MLRSGKLGLGSAYKHAARMIRGQYVVILDADLSHHPKFIPPMLAKLRETGVHIVAGSRYRVGGDGGVDGWDLKRKLVSRGANLLAQELLGALVSDVTSSFRVYERAAFDMGYPAVEANGYAFQMEILYRAHFQFEFKIAEIDITFGTGSTGAPSLAGTKSRPILVPWSAFSLRCEVSLLGRLEQGQAPTSDCSLTLLEVWGTGRM